MQGAIVGSNVETQGLEVGSFGYRKPLAQIVFASG
jgi:hypothetical protein